MDERGQAPLRYRAFLSYSHKDAAAAGRLHRRLETYRLPRRLVGRETPRGHAPARLWPIFRDRDELPAATDLSETVREALDQSGALVVLCSPNSAGSLWVAEEIRTFRSLHPDRPVLAVILDGDPPDCFPDEMRVHGADGLSHEPLATDLRPGGDGAQLGLLKLVAGITGLGLDDLVQRDAARRIRRVTAVTAGAVAAMLLMAVLTIVALNARAEAERQRAEAEGLIEFMLTDLRERLRGVGRLDVMTAVNERALDYYDRSDLANLPGQSLDQRSRILHAMGEDYLSRDEFPAAASAIGLAHRVTAEQLARDPGDADRIFAHAQSEYWVGYLRYRRRDFLGARQNWEQYKRLADRLVAIDPNNPDWVREAGYAEGNLCTIDVAPPQDVAAALQDCTASLQRMEQVRALSGLDPALALDLANRHGWLADAWKLAGRWDRVFHHRRRQEQLSRWLIRQDPDNLDHQDFWMRTQFTFGRLLRERGHEREAQRWFSDAAATADRLHAHDPENETWRDFRSQIDSARQQGG